MAGATELGWLQRGAQEQLGQRSGAGCVPQALSFSVPWLSKGSQHRGYLLGFYFSQFPFITIGQKHLISLPKRGLGEMVGFQFNNLPWLEMKALRWLAQYDSHRLCLTGL